MSCVLRFRDPNARARGPHGEQILCASYRQVVRLLLLGDITPHGLEDGDEIGRRNLLLPLLVKSAEGIIELGKLLL